MSPETYQKLKSQLGAILLSGLVAFFLAVIQAVAAANGLECKAAADPAVAGAGGIALKALHALVRRA